MSQNEIWTLKAVRLKGCRNTQNFQIGIWKVYAFLAPLSVALFRSLEALGGKGVGGERGRCRR